MPSPAPSAIGSTRFELEPEAAPDVVLDAAAAEAVVRDTKVVLDAAAAEAVVRKTKVVLDAAAAIEDTEGFVVKVTAVAIDVLVIEVVVVKSPESRAV